MNQNVPLAAIPAVLPAEFSIIWGSGAAAFTLASALPQFALQSEQSVSVGISI
jgi:hypothetical protein